MLRHLRSILPAVVVSWWGLGAYRVYSDFPLYWLVSNKQRFAWLTDRVKLALMSMVVGPFVYTAAFPSVLHDEEIRLKGWLRGEDPRITQKRLCFYVADDDDEP